MLPKISPCLLRATARSQEFRPARTFFPWPTPRPQSSDWMRELSEALSPHPNSGTGSEDIVALNNNFSGFSDNNTIHTPPPGAELGRILYSKLQKFPRLRQALSSVNAARAFKYGSRAFGHKRWYSEEFDITRGLKTKSRQQFRFGLKSNVEFLIQLDLENLRTCLLDSTCEINQNTPSSVTPLLSDGSFLNLMEKMNPTRCNKFCAIMNRLHGNLNFSLSLNEYFATDDMLEPALLLIAEAIRSGPNLGVFLRGGSVAASAMMYRHRASPSDHDCRATQRTNFAKNTFTRRPSGPGTRHQKLVYKYKTGYCFQFQHTGSCETTDCRYMHKCSQCNEPTHGQDSCQRD